MTGKISNFWYYYKVYVLVGLFILAVVFVLIMFSKGNSEPDIQIGYVTDGREIGEDAEAAINNHFEKVIQDVNKDDKKLLDFVPMMGPRVDVEFSDDGVQIMLMDGHTLQIYKEKGVFEPLDEFVDKYQIDISGNEEIMATPQGQSEKHIYALPMNKVKYLLDFGFPEENYYLTMRVEYEKNETSDMKNSNAHKVLEKMLEYEAENTYN